MIIVVLLSITFIELCVGEIKGKVYFKFHKVHSQSANSAFMTTKSALLHRKECFIERIKHSLWCNKVLFVGNKAQLPTCLSAG